MAYRTTKIGPTTYLYRSWFIYRLDYPAGWSVMLPRRGEGRIFSTMSEARQFIDDKILEATTGAP